MRLTKKDGKTYFMFDRNANWKRSVEITKLGQLEDIEEELDVDLLVFLKALKHGVFYKEFGDNKIRHTNNLRMSCFDGKRFCLANKEHYFLMEDYGKTKYNPWALTKEELL